MDKSAPNESAGMIIIALFLLIGLIVMGCMLYTNWVHRRQRFANSPDYPENEKTKTIYEKNNRGSYNRSTSLIITAATHPYTGSDAENGAVVQK